MSLDQVTEVFDTTEVSVADAEEDEDVEALMKELYDEAETTKDALKVLQGGSTEEEEAGTVEEQEEECEEDEYDYNVEGSAPIEQSHHVPSAPQQEANFLGYLEDSAAGKHENFQVYNLPSRGWTDEFRKTAEAMAFNVDAVTGGTSDKNVDLNIQSASRFLAYAVMLASVITLLAKASVTREDVPVDTVVAMAVASRSASGLEPMSEKNTALPDAAGDWKSLNREEFEKSAEETKRNEIAEKIHEKHMAELTKKDTNDWNCVLCLDHDKEEAKKRAEQEDAEKRRTLKQEEDEIKKVIEFAKSLERKEQEEDGKVDPEAAKIIAAAQSLAAKTLQKQNSKALAQKEADHRVQDELRRKEAAELAAIDSLTAVVDNHSSEDLNQAAQSIKETIDQAAQNAENAKANGKMDEFTRRAAKEQEQRLQRKQMRETEEKEREKQHEEALEKERRSRLEMAKIKVKQFQFQEEQEKYISESAPDLQFECGDWAKVGECEKNPDWMHENCATSCSKHLLIDKDHRCSAWADGGECEKNAIYMKHHCPQSCGVGFFNAPAPAPSVEDFARTKRAAKLKKKMKEQQVKDNAKPFIVRGKGLAKAAEEVLEEADSMTFRGRGAHISYKSAEDHLLDRLSNIPETTHDKSVVSAGSWIR